MKYDQPDLIDRLAGEYVLGTLRGPARQRFERLLGARLDARRAVQAWERRLTPLAFAVQPEVPPPRVYERLAVSLGLAPPERPRRGPPWAALAAGLAAVAVMLGVLATLRGPEVRVEVRETVRETARAPAYVVLVADAAARPVWLVQAYPELRELRVRAVAVPATAPEVYELWMLPDSGAAPVSLGLLPERGDVVLALDAARGSVLAATSTLAVSREPAGGSPTGAPTGPVLYTAPVLGAS